MSDDAAAQPENAQPAETPAVDPKVVEARTRYLVLTSWLDKLQSALEGLKTNGADALLFSRPSPNYFWEQIGFYIGPDEKDGGKQKAFAKVGRALAQPIGTILNGCEFYPLQSSKLLWAHDFAIAKLLPFVGAFKVERKADYVESENDKADQAALSDDERARMQEAMKDLGEEFDKINQIAATVPKDEAAALQLKEAYTEQVERIRDTVKLATLRIPRLDLRLQLMAAQNPEMKADLSGVDARTLAGACIEFLRMKLNDDNMRRHFQQNELVSTIDGAALSLVESLISKFEATLPADDKAAWDDQALKQLIEGSEVLYPALTPVITPFRDSTDLVACGRACLGILKLERARLAAT